MVFPKLQHIGKDFSIVLEIGQWGNYRGPDFSCFLQKKNKKRNKNIGKTYSPSGKFAEQAKLLISS